MARHVGKHGARHSLWGGVAVFVVIALTGFLLSTNVRVNRTVAATNDTADLVEQGVDEANQLQQDVSDLTKQVANLTDALKADGTDGTDSTQNQGKDSSNVDSSLMLPALSGSILKVLFLRRLFPKYRAFPYQPHHLRKYIPRRCLWQV